MTHSGSKRRKKHHEEEHENHERWLVSYADMVTLLMCLFIVLFAMSQVDTKKFNALANGLAEGFGSPMQILDNGTSSGEPSLNTALPAPVDIQSEAEIDGDPTTEAEEAAAAKVAADQARRAAAEAAAAYDNLDAARRAIDAALEAAGYAGSARFEIDERGLVVHIVADQVLFSEARADLRPEGRTVLDAVAPTLIALPNSLAIEGHTNHLPTDPAGMWPSNWELSAYRATTVLRYLAADGVPATRMQANGFADTKPLVPITDPTSLTTNRRVDIVVLSGASAAANALLPGIEAARSSQPAN